MTDHETDPPPDIASTDERRALRRHARIWLATLSTVVGVATGMFTLRDAVFQEEAGTAEAVSVPAFRQQVGEICDEVNENDRVRAQQDGKIRVRLQRAQTTLSQRNALLDGVQRTAAGSGHALASFDALETPGALADARRETQAAWHRNLARLRGYASRLDRAGSHTELLAAIDHLSRLRPLLAADGVKVASGLERLGGANCDLRPPRVTPAFTLPTLAGQGGRSANNPGADRASSANNPATRRAPSTNTSRSGQGRSANTPATRARPSRQTPTSPTPSVQTPQSVQTPAKPNPSVQTPGKPTPSVPTPHGGSASGSGEGGGGGSGG